MSAFICSDRHINAIVRFACKNNLRITHGNPSTFLAVPGNEQRVAEILLTENIRSVNYRYGLSDEDDVIVYDPFAPDLRPIEVIKACDCLAYQSCEHPAWDESLACKLLHEIQRKAVQLLPGYDKAPWEVTQ